MSHSLRNVNELKFLWKNRGNKNYDLKSFLTNDGVSISYMLFEDLQNRRNVFGKIVVNPREGEAYHWPRLQHENLAPLLDTVSINENVSIYILPAIGYNLKDIIHSKEFMMDLESFNRKRAYVKDILSALEYLHGKFLCITNLTDRIIYVSNISDKAILCDFHCVHLIGRTTKEDFDLPVLYQAPEINGEYVDPISVETWACGVVFLQIFTKDALPFAFVGDAVGRVLEAVEEINYDIIKEANPGAEVNLLVIEELKSFLSLFLTEDPKLRLEIQKSTESTFLNNLRRMEIKDDFKNTFWKPKDDFNLHRKFRKPEWGSSSYKKHLSSPFEDIYSKEVATYRDKLKKLPYTNKFINLKFVPHGDDVTKHLEKNKTRKTRVTDMTIRDKEKSIDEQTDSSELRSNSGVISVAIDAPKNFKSSKIPNNINHSNLTKLSSNFREVIENSRKNKAIHSFSALYKNDDTFKSSMNIEKNNEAEIAIIQLSSDSDVSLDSLESFQNKRKQAYVTHTKQKFGSNGIKKSSSYDLDLDTKIELKSQGTVNPIVSNSNLEFKSLDNVKSISCDSNLDTKLEFESHLTLRPSSCDSNLEFRSHDTVKPSNCDSKLDRKLEIEPLGGKKSISSTLESKLEFETRVIAKPSSCRSNLNTKFEFKSHDTLKSSISNSNLDRKLEFELNGTHCTIKTKQLCTDEDGMPPCFVIAPANSISKTKTESEQNSCNEAQSLGGSCITSATNIKDNIDCLDISPPTENNNGNCHFEIELSNSNELLDQKSKFHDTHVSQNNIAGDTIMINSQVEIQKELVADYDVNHQANKNDDVLTRGNVNIFKESAEAISFTNSANVKRINDNFNRNDSYRTAILNGQRDIVKHETFTPVEESKLKIQKKRSLLKFSLFHKKSVTTEKKATNEDSAKVEKSEHNSSFLTNEVNIQNSQNISSIEAYLLNSPREEKVKRRNWIRLLCPGGK